MLIVVRVAVVVALFEWAIFFQGVQGLNFFGNKVTTLDKPLYLLGIVDVCVTEKSFPQTIRKVNVTKRIVIGVVEKLLMNILKKIYL